MKSAHWCSLALLACGSGGAGGAGPPATDVRPGLEVAATDSIHLLRGKRVGLLVNAAAVDRQGRPAADRLRDAGVRVVALFSPEHGFGGGAKAGETIASTVDAETGLPIHSLYGATRAPTDEMLVGVEVLVADLPDVGARYYTYLSTLLEVMKSGAAHRIPVVVLDRPDPIGGAVQGNVLDPAHRSFVGALTVAMRHGMTLGELARLGNEELAIGAALSVIPASGWRRGMDQLDTGLPFLPPSRNLPRLEALFHYPGLCLFEGTPFSVGRGTDHPFEQIGAAWLDTTVALARLRRLDLPGVRLEATRFRPVGPEDDKFPDTLVAGVRFVMTDRARYDAPAATLRVLLALRDLYPERVRFLGSFDRLAGGPALREAIERGETAEAILARWDRERDRFRADRRRFLLYPD